MERGAPPAVVPTVIMPSAHPPELRSAGKISTSKWLSNHSNHSNLASDDEDAMHRRANPRRGPSRESQPGGRARRSDSNVSRGDDGYGSGPAAPTGRATRSRASLQSAPAASPTPEPEPQPRTLRARKSVIKDDEQDDDVDGEGEPDPDVVMPANDRARRSSGRIRISSTTDDEEGQRSPRIATTSTRGRSGARSMYYDGPVSDESSDGLKPPRLLRRSRQRNDEFVENDDDFDQNEVVDEGYGVRRSSRHTDTGSRRMTRSSNRRSPSDEPRGRKNDAAYDESTELSSSDDEDDEEEDEDDEDEQGVKKTYTFRQRAKKVNYFLPPVNTFDMLPTDRNDKGKGKGKAQKHSGSWLPPNMSTAQYAALYPEKARDPPDSVWSHSSSVLCCADATQDDENNEFPSPRKTNLFSTRSSGFQGSGMLAGAAGQDVPGAPNNLGKITASELSVPSERSLIESQLSPTRILWASLRTSRSTLSVVLALTSSSSRRWSRSRCSTRRCLSDSTSRRRAVCSSTGLPARERRSLLVRLPAAAARRGGRSVSRIRLESLADSPQRSSCAREPIVFPSGSVRQSVSCVSSSRRQRRASRASSSSTRSMVSPSP